MNFLREYAKRWASRASNDNAALLTSLFLSVMGIGNLVLYFTGTVPSAGILGAGIALLCIGFLLFERSEFIALHREQKNKDEIRREP